MTNPQQANPRLKKIAMWMWAAVAAIVAVVAIGIIGALAGDSDGEDNTHAPAPDYAITSRDTTGNKRNIIAEVDTADDLRAVFDYIANGLTDEAGYSIMINCSTGGTDAADNRLANGQVAIGSLGAATTGLEEGGTEFMVNEGRTCSAEQNTTDHRHEH
ncbi:hypothetical protein [Streptomyces sp. 6N223]|uniref:hypothetical protein n=1 Tax=Streptomyces sp. 6N223 TaxID=3457412 RepID=UPI003FD536DF